MRSNTAVFTRTMISGGFTEIPAFREHGITLISLFLMHAVHITASWDAAQDNSASV